MTNEKTINTVKGAKLVCFALWGVVTLMMTAALTSAVSVPAHNETATTVHTVTE